MLMSSSRLLRSAHPKFHARSTKYEPRTVFGWACVCLQVCVAVPGRKTVLTASVTSAREFLCALRDYLGFPAHSRFAGWQVARRMLKNPTRTAALGGGSRLDPRALVGPLPSSHQRLPWKPEVVGVQQTVDLGGHGSVVFSSSFGRPELDSAATSIGGDL